MTAGHPTRHEIACAIAPPFTSILGAETLAAADRVLALFAEPRPTVPMRREVSKAVREALASASPRSSVTDVTNAVMALMDRSTS
jgi:hypothetical protein